MLISLINLQIAFVERYCLGCEVRRARTRFGRIRHPYARFEPYPKMNRALVFSQLQPTILLSRSFTRPCPDSAANSPDIIAMESVQLSCVGHVGPYRTVQLSKIIDPAIERRRCVLH